MTDFRKNKPEVLGEINFHLPTIETTAINNITLNHVQKTNLPICQIEVIIDCGSKFDPAGKEGLSHLTAMMLDEGAGKYTSLQLSEEFEKIGSIFSISTDDDAIHVSVLSLEEYFERSIELLSLVLLHPTFANDDFERERKKLVAKILQSKDNPSVVANSVFDKIVYSGSSYANSIMGSKESVESLTLDDIKSFYNNKLLTSKWNTISVGTITNDEILKTLKRYLSLTQKQVGTEAEEIILSRQSKTKVYVVDHEGAAQTEIMIGHLADKRKNGDYFPKHLLNSILGGQFTSRINLNLREDKGYTYGAGSTFNYSKEAAAFYVSTSVQSEVTGNAVKEILYELERIKDGVTNDELDFAKSSLIKKFPSQFETYSQVANNIANILIHGLDPDYYNNYIDNLTKSTIDEVNDAAIKHIRYNELVIVCVGNSSVIKEHLSELFDYEIVELDKDGNAIS